ncbi:Mediator of RNA polymerase II transcription subunit 10 [Liparis tanakae]|uniref:Mediator of RNA polymerase II transcription subunit 10 n=1 Tax=Liparis tanakae TaxID=230148 RepID=A0A4Z2EQA3_9TELE|nr:Mediator of RNA polymerase II transcription subunit 10 [Liparis tanakae]
MNGGEKGKLSGKVTLSRMNSVLVSFMSCHSAESLSTWCSFTFQSYRLSSTSSTVMKWSPNRRISCSSFISRRVRTWSDRRSRCEQKAETAPPSKKSCGRTWELQRGGRRRAFDVRFKNKMAEKFDNLEEHLEKFIENIRQLGIIVSDFQPSSQTGLNQKLNFMISGLQDIEKCRQQLHETNVPLEVFE